jgi:hypothetical protein
VEQEADSVFTFAQEPDWGRLSQALKGFNVAGLRVVTMRRDRWGYTIEEDNGRDDAYQIERALFPYEGKNGKSVQRTKPLKPKKSKEPFVQIASTKVTSLSAGGEASVYFDHKAKTITWEVGENNRAVERANETDLAKLLWRLLNGIAWTRGSGGKIVGNDEYNQESREAGSGSNYVTREFGPSVQRRQNRHFAANYRTW